MTKSCYPNLKPLFEVYCIHCVKTDKSLDDKDVVDVADEIVSCLASYGIEDMLELEKLVIEKDGNEKTTDAVMSDLLSNYTGLENLLEEPVINLLIDLIYDSLRIRSMTCNSESNQKSLEKASSLMEFDTGDNVENITKDGSMDSIQNLGGHANHKSGALLYTSQPYPR